MSQSCPGQDSIILWFISSGEELKLNEVELSILNFGYHRAPDTTQIVLCIPLSMRHGLGKYLEEKQKLCLETINFLCLNYLGENVGEGKRDCKGKQG